MTSKMTQDIILKHAKISANGIRKNILIQRLNKNLFLPPLVDIYACFMQKLIFFFFLEIKTSCLVVLLVM